MPNKKIITIEVGVGGETSHLKTEGFAGATCKAASAPYERVLGEKTAEHDTAEMRQSAAQVQQQQVGH